ncbi:hypothetical protein KVT40_004580 [Elsinoe batatas]|uniref:Uncharacterized protein n=1 Tax=Elsinoe batatas TaxID=2601811 RepID=A0A8K0L100_9PEZI|nr:hypothetical protein KVT40_004580 [Elsinoe batatas]
MKSAFALVALTLATLAAAAGQCSLQPFDGNAIQALTGGGGTGGTAPIAAPNAPKKRSSIRSISLFRRAEPTPTTGTSTAIQPPVQGSIPNNRGSQTQTQENEIEMVPPPNSNAPQQSSSTSGQPAPGTAPSSQGGTLPFTNQNVEQQQQGTSSQQTQQGGTGLQPSSGQSKGVARTCLYGICAGANWVFNKVTGAGNLSDPAAINKLRNDWGRTITAGLIAGTIAAITIERQIQASQKVAQGQQALQAQNAQMINLMKDILAAGRCNIGTSGQALSDFCQGIANPQAAPAKRGLTLAARDTSSSCPKISDQQKSDALLKLAESEGLGKLQSGGLDRIGIAFDGYTDAWVIFDPNKYPKSLQQLKSKGMIPTDAGKQTASSSPTAGGPTTVTSANTAAGTGAPANGAPASGGPVKDAPTNGQTGMPLSGQQSPPGSSQQNTPAASTTPASSASSPNASPNGPKTSPQAAPQTGKPNTPGQTTATTGTKPAAPAAPGKVPK